MNKKTIAIILAGGKGERAGGTVPKQFIEVAGKPLIVHAIERFSLGYIDGIIVVSLEKYIDKVKRMIEKYGIKRNIDIIPGDVTRQGSSFNGVNACPRDTAFVLIHDAARPFVEEKIIRDVLDAAMKYGVAIPVIETSDTAAFEKDGFVDDIPERGKLKRIQTPQGFSYETIHRAHRSAKEEGITDVTDDCGLVKRIGGKVRMIEGSILNIKLTDRYDIEISEKIIGSIRGKETA
ncbi:MAG: 2-C-methyl-D-erythritol 4-phosphate cytidylyltransferase [Candidatus Omnitrophota bacterium]